MYSSYLLANPRICKSSVKVSTYHRVNATKITCLIETQASKSENAIFINEILVVPGLLFAPKSRYTRWLFDFLLLAKDYIFYFDNIIENV